MPYTASTTPEELRQMIDNLAGRAEAALPQYLELEGLYRQAMSDKTQLEELSTTSHCQSLPLVIKSITWPRHTERSTTSITITSTPTLGTRPITSKIRDVYYLLHPNAWGQILI